MLNQPKNIYPPIHIYVADTGTDIGRGVFAVHSFSKDDIVEISPVILIENIDWKELPIELRNRVFNWKKLAEFSEVTSKAKNAIALGYGSIYNHCDDPNLRYEAIPEEKLIRFIARRSINPNEQLTINYTHHDGIDKSVKKGWFEINQIEKLDIDN